MQHNARMHAHTRMHARTHANQTIASQRTWVLMLSKRQSSPSMFRSPPPSYRFKLLPRTSGHLALRLKKS